MELHIALRNIIQTDGPDILKDVRLVNMLDDFHAYVDIPSAKYILRAIIADGFTQKLLNIGEWNNENRQLVGKFISATGFSSELVEIIFEALVYGLGWNLTVLSLKDKGNGTQYSNPENIGHLKFMGIPITGSPKDFVNRLKEKGFKVISKKRVSELALSNEYDMVVWGGSDAIYIKGSFSIFSDCIIGLQVSPFTHEIYSVSVFPRLYTTWEWHKYEYEKVKEMLTKKYGLPSPQQCPDQDFETFETKDGWIIIEFVGDSSSDVIYTFEISYNDNQGWEKHEIAKKTACEEDL